MNRSTTNLLLPFAFLALVACSRKQDPLPWRLDTYLQAAQQHEQFQGSVLVATGDRIDYERQVGYADISTKRLIDRESLFELASVSKQFTATGILLLAEQGKLSVEDSLRKFFPELPYVGITLHHMLTHTSGLPDYEEVIESHWDRTKIAFNDDVIRLLAEHRPAVLFKPGDEWRYSNTGFMLLASIIERVSGEKYGDFLKKNIFDPLQMTRTRTYNTRRSGEVIENYAYGYIYDDSAKVLLLPDSVRARQYVYYMDGIQGDGVVNSTARDLLKWHQGLRDGKVLSPASLAKAYTDAILNSGKPVNYGYGWSVRTDSTNGRVVEHGGSWPGYGTFIRRYLDQDKVIIVLSNTEKYIQEAVDGFLFDRPVELPHELQWLSPPSDLSAWEGRFVVVGDETDTITYFSKDGKLMGSTGQWQWELKFANDGRFYSVYRSLVGLGMDSGQTGQSFYWIESGVKRRLRKL
ncbi:MAG: serine hydrolase domain-containing protein [Cyclobacteriaceae bacterium]|jgi:CubicO group peptidase (beta-lactamase class C family)